MKGEAVCTCQISSGTLGLHEPGCAMREKAGGTTLVPTRLLLFEDRPPLKPLDPFVVMSVAHDLRHTYDEVDPPIEVIPEGDYFRVWNGHHRAIAHMMAGRRFILAEITNE
jgi:hypothetical protein